jgi:hypothetical protein
MPTLTKIKGLIWFVTNFNVNHGVTQPTVHKVGKDFTE